MTARVLHMAVGRPTAPYGEQLGDVTRYATEATHHVRELGHQLGAELVELSGALATRDRAAHEIRAARAALSRQAPSLFVLSFTGHGGKIADEDGDEVIDHEDEAWALDDAPLIDDEIMALLGEFPDHVNIAILSNCCFAGGIDDAQGRGFGVTRDGDPGFASPDQIVAARRMSWNRIVARLGEDRLYAPLATRDGSRARRRSPPFGITSRGEDPVDPPPRKRVLAAVCQFDQTFLAPSTSVFSSTILDAVFPPAQDGSRQRAPEVTYHAVGQALANIDGLPLFARPSITGPEAVLRGLAFVAT